MILRSRRRLGMLGETLPDPAAGIEPAQVPITTQAQLHEILISLPPQSNPDVNEEIGNAIRQIEAGSMTSATFSDLAARYQYASLAVAPAPATPVAPAPPSVPATGVPATPINLTPVPAPSREPVPPIVTQADLYKVLLALPQKDEYVLNSIRQIEAGGLTSATFSDLAAKYGPAPALPDFSRWEIQLAPSGRSFLLSDPATKNTIALPQRSIGGNMQLINPSTGLWDSLMQTQSTDVYTDSVTTSWHWASQRVYGAIPVSGSLGTGSGGMDILGKFLSVVAPYAALAFAGSAVGAAIGIGPLAPAATGAIESGGALVFSDLPLAPGAAAYEAAIAAPVLASPASYFPQTTEEAVQAAAEKAAQAVIDHAIDKATGFQGSGAATRALTGAAPFVADSVYTPSPIEPVFPAGGGMDEYDVGYDVPEPVFYPDYPLAQDQPIFYPDYPLANEPVIGAQVYSDFPESESGSFFPDIPLASDEQIIYEEAAAPGQPVFYPDYPLAEDRQLAVEYFPDIPLAEEPLVGAQVFSDFPEGEAGEFVGDLPPEDFQMPGSSAPGGSRPEWAGGMPMKDFQKLFGSLFQSGTGEVYRYIPVRLPNGQVGVTRQVIVNSKGGIPGQPGQAGAAGGTRLVTVTLPNGETRTVRVPASVADKMRPLGARAAQGKIKSLQAGAEDETAADRLGTSFWSKVWLPALIAGGVILAARR